MDFTLKIVFTGLMAFVPLKNGEVMYEIRPDLQPDEIRVLLVDARHKPEEQDAEGKPFEHHGAALRFDIGHWAPGRLFDERGAMPNRHHPDTTAIIWLVNERLTIHTESPPSPPLMVTGKRLWRWSPCCTKRDGICEVGPDTVPSRRCLNLQPDAPEQMRDSEWLISLSEVLEGSAAPSGKPELDLESAAILAELRIARGTLETLQLSGEPRDEQRMRYQVPTVQFLPPPRPPWNLIWQRRAVAQKMVLLMPARDSVEFRSVPLGGGPARPAVILKPPPHCALTACEVVVDLMNSPEPEIRKRWELHMPPDGMSRRHFELLWKLTRNPPSPRPAPFNAQFVGDLLCPEVRP